MPQSTSTSVYRYYDAHDVLIYVGITSRGVSRNVEHNKSRPWWRHVSRQDVEHFPTRELAHAREVALIERHTPPFNVQHNRDHRTVQAAYLAVTGPIADQDPTEILLASAGAIPIQMLEECVKDGQRIVSFRTEASYAPLARKVQHLGSVKLRDAKGVGVGHVVALERCGPFLVIRACVRNGIGLADAVAHVKRLSVKGPAQFALRRVSMAVSTQLDQCPDLRA